MQIDLDWRGTIEPDHEFMEQLELSTRHESPDRQRFRLARVKAKPIALWMADCLNTWQLDKAILYFVTRDMAKHLVFYLKPFQARAIYPGNMHKDAKTAIERFQANYKRRVLLCRHDIPLRIKGYETFDCEIPDDAKPRGNHQFVIPSLHPDQTLMGFKNAKTPKTNIQRNMRTTLRRNDHHTSLPEARRPKSTVLWVSN